MSDLHQSLSQVEILVSKVSRELKNLPPAKRASYKASNKFFGKMSTGLYYINSKAGRWAIRFTLEHFNFAKLITNSLDKPSNGKGIFDQVKPEIKDLVKAVGKGTASPQEKAIFQAFIDYLAATNNYEQIFFLLGKFSKHWERDVQPILSQTLFPAIEKRLTQENLLLIKSLNLSIDVLTNLLEQTDKFSEESINHFKNILFSQKLDLENKLPKKLHGVFLSSVDSIIKNILRADLDIEDKKNVLKFVQSFLISIDTTAKNGDKVSFDKSLFFDSKGMPKRELMLALKLGLNTVIPVLNNFNTDIPKVFPKPASEKELKQSLVFFVKKGLETKINHHNIEGLFNVIGMHFDDVVDPVFKTYVVPQIRMLASAENKPYFDALDAILNLSKHVIRVSSVDEFMDNLEPVLSLLDTPLFKDKMSKNMRAGLKKLVRAYFENIEKSGLSVEDRVAVIELIQKIKQQALTGKLDKSAFFDELGKAKPEVINLVSTYLKTTLPIALDMLDGTVAVDEVQDTLNNNDSGSEILELVEGNDVNEPINENSLPVAINTGANKINAGEKSKVTFKGIILAPFVFIARLILKLTFKLSGYYVSSKQITYKSASKQSDEKSVDAVKHGESGHSGDNRGSLVSFAREPIASSNVSVVEPEDDLESVLDLQSESGSDYPGSVFDVQTEPDVESVMSNPLSP